MSSLSPKAIQRGERLLAWGYYAAVIGLGIAAARLVVGYAFPLAAAWATAALLQRPIRWLVRKTRVSRPFFAVLSVVIAVLLLTGIVLLIGWYAVNFAADYVGREETVRGWQSAIQELSETLNAAVGRLTRHLSPAAAESVRGAAERLSESLMQRLTDGAAQAASGAVGYLTRALPGLLIGAIVWVAASVMFTAEYDRIKAAARRILPERVTESLRKAGEWGGRTAARLVRAYLLLLILTFAELSAGLWLLKVPHAAALSAGIAVIDLLPVLGVGTVLIPWGALLLLSGKAALGGGILLLYLATAIVRHIVEPRLVGRQLGLHPLATLAAMYIGLRMCGLAGVLLFPLAALALREMYRQKLIFAEKT